MRVICIQDELRAFKGDSVLRLWSVYESNLLITVLKGWSIYNLKTNGKVNRIKTNKV